MSTSLMGSRSRGFSMLAALAAVAMTGAAFAATPRREITVRRESIPEFSVAPNFYWNSQRRAGPGWTQAQQKRIAKKRRNVLRNRKAHRG